MEERKLICIGCPMGCPLTVEIDGGEVVSVTGNTCKRGDVYARKEVTNPTRIVTSTVRHCLNSILCLYALCIPAKHNAKLCLIVQTVH